MRDVEGLDPELFNPLFMYHTTSGGQDRGSTLADNLRFAREKGCCPEAVWPRAKGFRATPSEEAYAAAKNYRIDEFYEISNAVELGSALFQRFAVYAAYSGHAWLTVRQMNRQQIKWRNSWGTSWGDQGFGILNVSRVQFSYGIFAIRSTVVEADS